MGPLYKYGLFDFAYSLQLAGLIGFCFGFLLERAGFGNPRKLTSIFYLRDFAVLKVMFTAIVVCILGLLYFSVLGWIDMARVYILPTYIWPQIVGGLILGVGFVMGGYCPTTSVVATVSGKLDGLIFVIGMIIGSFLFGEFFPLFENFYSSGSMGTVTLSQVLNIQSGLIALGICVMALAVYWLAEKVEGKFGDPEDLPQTNKKVKLGAALALIVLGIIIAAINPDRVITARRANPKAATEIKQPTPSPSPSQGETGEGGAIIVEDEGC
ncbi:MAG: sulfurtransferase [Deltaproteobacteria bacterium]|nr:MAG: sulfurtransferase [Deltaproteobacteria bacterium]